MLPFLKRKFPALDIAEVAANTIQNRFETNMGIGLPPVNSALGLEIVKDEWLHFGAFCFDYSTYLALKQTPARKAIVHHFWSSMENWSKIRQSPSAPERVGLLANKLTTMPAESREVMHSRMLRRISLFAEAMKTSHSMGENFVVAQTLAFLCGEMGMSYIVGVSDWFSFYKIETSKFLKRYRILEIP